MEYKIKRHGFVKDLYDLYYLEKDGYLYTYEIAYYGCRTYFDGARIDFVVPFDIDDPDKSVNRFIKLLLLK